MGYEKKLPLQSQTTAEPISQKIYMVQGDTGRKINCNVVDIDISAITGARVFIKKPDNTSVYADCTIENGLIVVPITANMISVVGTAEAQVKMTLSGGYIDSFVFYIVVLESITDGSAVQSSNEYTTLQTLIVTADNLRSKLDAISDKIDSLQNTSMSGAIAVNSVADMTDTNKIYLLKSDGKLYFHNGTRWSEYDKYITEETFNSTISEKFRSIDEQQKVKLILNNGSLEFLSSINDDKNISLRSYLPNRHNDNQSYQLGDIYAKDKIGSGSRKIKNSTDDIPGVHFNQSARGGLHGESGGYMYKFAYNNDGTPPFTENNIGEIWTDEKSSTAAHHILIIYSVENDDSNQICQVYCFEPENSIDTLDNPLSRYPTVAEVSSYNPLSIPSFTKAIRYRSSGTPGKLVNISDTSKKFTGLTSLSRQQIRPVIQNQTVKIVKYDAFGDGEELPTNANGEYLGHHFDVIVSYDIIYTPDYIKYLIDNVGNLSNDFAENHIFDKYCTVINTYRYMERGSIVGFHSVEFYKEVDLNWAGFTQSLAMSNTSKFRVPLTSYFRDTSNGEYVFSREGGNACWDDDETPPTRFYQTVSTRTNLYSFCQGYCPEHGTDRKFADGELTKNAGAMTDADKLYAYYITGARNINDREFDGDVYVGGKNTSENINAISFRLVIDNTYAMDDKDDENEEGRSLLVTWYEVHDDIYLLIDCQKEIDKFIKLPSKFIGRKITFLEKSGEIDCGYKFVTSDGIKIKVGIPDGETLGYGSAVIKLTK